MRWVLVFKNTCNCGVVKSAHACEIGTSGHEETGIRETGFGFEKNVKGLAWGDEKGVCFERFKVNSIGFNYDEGVVGYAKEELVVECSVDQTEEICFSWLHL